jgi:protein O-mannosyl-transferase
MQTLARHPLSGVSLALLAVVVGVATALFFRVQGYPFLQWDDPHYVVNRPELHQIAHGQPSAIGALLSPATALRGAFFEYYPVRDATYALDAWRGGLAPRPFHQTNLVLHVISTVLLFLLGWLLGLRPISAVVASALFALHPLAVEPVTWVSGRKDALYVCLGLGALVCFVAARTTASRARAAILGAAFAALALLAAGSKGPGAIVVAIAVWIAWLVEDRQRRRWWPWLAALAAIASAWLALALVIGRRNQIVIASADGLAGGLFRAIGAPVRALASFLLPLDLSPRCDAWPWPAWLDPHSWATLLAAIVAVVLWRARILRASLPLLLVGALLLAVAPTSGIVSVEQVRADRFLYLPLCLLALLAAWGGEQLAARRWSLALLVVVPLLGFGLKTHRYLDAWRSDVDFWSYQYRQDPTNPITSGALAALAIEQGHLEVAKPLLDRALRGAPRVAVSWVNLGLWWQIRAGAGPLSPTDGQRNDRLRQAEGAYRRAIELDPARARAWLGLGLIASWRGDARAAEESLRRAAALPHGAIEAAIQLGDLLWTRGRRAEALAVVRGVQGSFPDAATLAAWLDAHPSPR